MHNLLRKRGLYVFPCQNNKKPLVNKGQSWRDAGRADATTLNWSTGSFGIEIPEGLIILDLDKHKGVTEEQVEQEIGCKLDWKRSKVQDTPKGGSHHAFRVDYECRQITTEWGLDTRVAGKGYIASGVNYKPASNGLGLTRLANPMLFPVMPSRYFAKHKFEVVQCDAERCLQRIDPNCTRDQWLKVGLSLRSYFKDRPDHGFSLFDQWSSGKLRNEETPPSYEPDTIEAQWDSFKPDGDITDKTLYYIAGLSPVKNAFQVEYSADLSHAQNAKAYLNSVELMKKDGELYRFTGKIWERWTFDELKHDVTQQLVSHHIEKSSFINSVIDVLIKLIATMKASKNSTVFSNGTLDEKGSFSHNFRSDQYNTQLLDYNYEPEAKCPQWRAFLKSSLDDDCILLLQEWFGYTLSSQTNHHKIFLGLGAPRSGKSTITRVLRALVGESNYSGCSLESFAIDSVVASWIDKKAVVVGDAAKRLSNTVVHKVTERIKSISGEDEITFDRKYLSAISTKLNIKITVMSNVVPSLFDSSGALASRVLLLPFYVSFLGREDHHLIDRLLPELSGIRNWAVQGLERLNANRRFTTPESSILELEQLEEDYSPARQFVKECMIEKPGNVITNDQIWNAYQEWQQDNVLLPRLVVLRMIREGVRHVARLWRSNRQRGLIGVGLIK